MTRVIQLEGNGLAATLTLAPSSAFAVELDDRRFSDVDAIRIEVLMQPRDPHGLPTGLVTRVFEGTWDVRERRAIGRLPETFSPEFLVKCHFRVTPIMPTIPR